MVAHSTGGAQYNLSTTRVTDNYANRANLDDDNFRVVANVFIHGESDAALNTPSTYQAQLGTRHDDYQASVRAITGQSQAVPLFVWQLSTGTDQGAASVYIQRRNLLADAQLAASEARPNEIFMLGPKYMITHGDGTHLTNVGYRRLGEYTGMALDAVLVDGLAWRALSPSSITASGSNIRVCYNVPCDLMGTCGATRLALDTTNVTCPEHTRGDGTCRYGFELIDPNPIPRYITSVAVDGATSCVDIATNGAVNTGSYLAYAFSGLENADGGPGTAAGEFANTRGNLRDTNTIVGYHSGSALYNWAVHMGPRAISGGSAPAATVATVLEDKDWAWYWTSDDCPAAASAWPGVVDGGAYSMPYSSGTFTCGASTHASLSATAIGSARVNAALDGDDVTPGCWTTAVGQSTFNVATNSDIHYRYVGVLGRAASTYRITAFEGDSGTNNRWHFAVTNTGQVSTVFESAGSNITFNRAGLIPASPTWGVLDVYYSKNGNSTVADRLCVTVCWNGDCAISCVAGVGGATGTGRLAINGAHNCTLRNPFPVLMHAYSTGQQARAKWIERTDDFAAHAWRQNGHREDALAVCSLGLNGCQ